MSLKNVLQQPCCYICNLKKPLHQIFCLVSNDLYLLVESLLLCSNVAIIKGGFEMYKMTFLMCKN